MIDLHTYACDLLGCEQPVILAGMGGVARSELVAAVSEAGGFGFLGMVRESPRLIREEIAQVRANTSHTFGVNLIPAATDPERLRAEIATCLEAKVHAVALFWDLAPDVVAELHDAGIVVVCQVGSVAEAIAADRAGADILVAQGVEAGGHVRGLTVLATLGPDVVAAVDKPVLAAGGIVDGFGLASALLWGAQGVVVGTAFLATRESFAHDYHKDRIVAAGPDETRHTDAFHINWPAGAMVRVLPNSVTRGDHGDPHAAGEPRVIGQEGRRAIHLFSTDSPLRSMTGDFEAMALYAGQGAGRLSDIVPAAERLRSIVAEAAALLQSPPGAALETSAAGGEPSSPVCYAAQADDAYMGYLPRAELVAELNTLLEAERAGARVAARLVRDLDDEGLKTLARAVHADETRWCRMLLAALADLEAQPSSAVGSFYDKASAIADPLARTAFLNRGQGWVVRKLRELLPRVRDDRLHGDLRQMLAAHEVNIDQVNIALAPRAS